MKIITERNILISIVTLLIITTIIDLYTALSSDIFNIAEANPIYILTGSIYVLIVLSIATMSYMIYNLFKSLSLTRIFIFTILGLYLIMLHCVGAYTNIQANNEYEKDPEGVQEAYTNMSNNTKLKSYVFIVGLFAAIPYFISVLAFYLTHKIYINRKSKRDKIVDKICKLTRKLEG